MPTDSSAAAQAQSINQQLELFDIYRRVPYLSVKHDSYFQVYEELLRPYVGKPITFVEIGILHGGSLFMWREYLGPQARIIGVDLNPAARSWESHGFEIFVGDQADPAFWDAFYAQVGPIDVLLDDGGHMNHQQIVTVEKALEQINDGGMILVEDVHASYLPEFGNPSNYSFINYAKKAVDSINARFPAIHHAGPDAIRRKAYSITFYESIVALRIDRRRSFVSSWASNGGAPHPEARDFRHEGAVRSVIF